MSQFKNFNVIKAKLEIGTALTWATTAVDLVSDTIKIANHGLFTGQSCGLTSSSALPTGLATATAYYVIVVDLNTIAFATSVANALAGTKINLTAVGSGTGSLYPNGFGVVQLRQFIPDNAIITRAFYDVVTTFVSTDGATPATDAGTIALSTSGGANQLVSAAAISTGTTWDAAGAIVTIPIETTATMLKMSADVSLIATIAVEVVTAGKLYLYVEYLLSE